jgi:hypothetical protein
MTIDKNITEFEELFASILKTMENTNKKESDDFRKKFIDITNNFQIPETPNFESEGVIRQRLKASYCTYDKLLAFTTGQVSWNDSRDYENDALKALNEKLLLVVDFFSSSIEIQHAIYLRENKLSKLAHLANESASFIEGQVKGKETGDKIAKTKKARFAAAQRHKRTNEAKAEIVKIWLSGKYSSRDICAEQECAALNLSFSTARKALRGTPNPTPKT